MPLNPTEKKFAEALEAYKRANPGKPYKERTLAELRAATTVLLQHAGNAAEVSYSDCCIPTRDGAPMALRIYNDRLSENSPDHNTLWRA